jgi:hypothetical protein
MIRRYLHSSRLCLQKPPAPGLTTIQDDVKVNHFPMLKPHMKDPEFLRRHLDLRQASCLQTLERHLHQSYPQADKIKAQATKRQAAILIPFCSIQLPPTTSGTLPSIHPAILFTVRNLNMRSHGGEVSFPGGLFEQDDVDAKGQPLLERTALRETGEELPSLQGHIRILGRLRSVLDKSQTIEVHPFVGYINTDPLPVASLDTMDLMHCVQWSSDEVHHVFAMPLSWLLDTERLSTQYFRGLPQLAMPTWTGPLVPVGYPSDRYREENVIVKQGQMHYRIWGLSAYVLARLLKQSLIPMLTAAVNPHSH